MGERTSYEPGTFCAVDLSSPDREASKAFYVALFGWEVPESAGLEASVARIEQLGGAVAVPPVPAGPGRIAVAADPHGAFFGLYEGQVDP